MTNLPPLKFLHEHTVRLAQQGESSLPWPICHHGAACRHQSCLVACLRGFRNGFAYGLQIRSVHAAVMTLVYRRNQPWKKSVEWIVRMSWEHAWNLGRFAFTYKALVCLMTNLTHEHSPLWGAIAGYLAGLRVWGAEKSAVNYQLVLYLISRNLAGVIELHRRQGGRLDWIGKQRFYPQVAALTWALVMYLFELKPEQPVLQPSLDTSMKHLYHESDHWSVPSDFIPLPAGIVNLVGIK